MSIITPMIIDYKKQVRDTYSQYAKIFGILRSVLDPTTKDRVERAPGYQRAQSEGDPVAFWHIIVQIVGMQATTGDTEDTKQTVKLMYQQESMWPHEPLLTFLKLRLENCRLMGVTEVPDDAGAARDFYSKLDVFRNGRLYTEKRNMVKRSIDIWPTTLREAYEEVESWIPQTWRAAEQKHHKPTVFASHGGDGPSEETLSKFPCHKCSKYGHWKNQCPSNKDKQDGNRETYAATEDKGKRGKGQGKKGANNKPDKKANGDSKPISMFTETTCEEVNQSYVFASKTALQAGDLKLSKDDMLYDTASDTMVVRNKDMLVDDSVTSTNLSATGVTGKRPVSSEGFFPFFGQALVVPSCMANIKLFHIDHKPGAYFNVHVNEDIILRFTKRKYGFSVCNMREHLSKLYDLHRAKLTNRILVTTVNNKERTYTKREVNAVGEAMELQRTLGYPSQQEVINSLRSGAFVDCPLTVQDVVRSANIWAAIKGKTTDPVPTENPRSPYLVILAKSKLCIPICYLLLKYLF